MSTEPNAWLGTINNYMTRVTPAYDVGLLNNMNALSKDPYAMAAVNPQGAMHIGHACL